MFDKTKTNLSRRAASELVTGGGARRVISYEIKLFSKTNEVKESKCSAKYEKEYVFQNFRKSKIIKC